MYQNGGVLTPDTKPLLIENIDDDFNKIYEKVIEEGLPDHDEEIKIKINENIWFLSCTASPLYHII